MSNLNELIFIPQGAQLNNLKALDNVAEEIGIRGLLLLELTSINLPIAPAVIIPASVLKLAKDPAKLESYINAAIVFLENQTQKRLNDEKTPLFCKIVLSPSINVSNVPSVHNVGLTSVSAQAYERNVDPAFVAGEWSGLLESIVALSSGRHTQVYGAKKEGTKTPAENKVLIDAFLKIDPGLDDPKIQYIRTIKALFENFYKEEANQDVNTAIIIQAMVYGNWGKNSLVGRFTTRDPGTGEKAIAGIFAPNTFSVDDPSGTKQPVQSLDLSYAEPIKKYALDIEEKFLEMREVNFAIENGVLWVIDQKEVKTSTRAQLRLLLDLKKSGKIDDAYLFSRFQPKQLLELLHARLKSGSVHAAAYEGGIAGSPGAAVGKVYFSTPSFLKAFNQAKALGENPHQILAMRATYAEDVQAIELGTGVISAEGGFSSHAPVVARSFGKPAMVDPAIQFVGDYMLLPNGHKVREGDGVSFEVSYDKKPLLYPELLDLEYPDVQANGLTEFITYLKPYTKDFKVRCNADQSRDAKVGKMLGGEGIGLCRTEHMFFEAKRIMKVRHMLLAGSKAERIKALEAIKDYQKQDFLAILEVLDGEPLNVRLLDAPLHEFLPKNEEEFNATYKYLTEMEGLTLTPEETKNRFSVMHEVNPMLGHRGCRIAITYPEIYHYQTEALLEAALEASKVRKVSIEIMIPMVMTDRELDIIIDGKEIEGEFLPGLLDVEDKVMKKYNLTSLPFEYKWGTMVELPVAALCADQLAQYASYFSFGTNDLTQTTLGLSRDDINSFYSDYSKFDIFEFNPFQKLNSGVKQLILMAMKKGRMVRPDLKLGICGEHGADPDAVLFSIQNGLNYVSCSPYSIPIALLTVAKHFAQNP